MREFLRQLPVFSGMIMDFDPAAVPDDPVDLFTRWLHEAVAEGVPEPHAMVLSTCDADGGPDARALILKDLDDRGWWFATNALSPKGIQLSAQPAAALTFYWPQMARQVRVRGPVERGTAAHSTADFRERGSSARAVALVSQESQPLTDRRECAAAIAEAERRLSENPNLIAPHWQTYAVNAHTVEFWQADKDRQHLRVRYTRDSAGWVHTLLWP